MKRLLPSLRAKKRYLAFELISEEPASRSDIVKEVMSSASSLLGDVTTSDCDIRVLGFENGKALSSALTQKLSKREPLWLLLPGSTVKGQLCTSWEFPVLLKGLRKSFCRMKVYSAPEAW